MDESHQGVWRSHRLIVQIARTSARTVAQANQRNRFRSLQEAAKRGDGGKEMDREGDEVARFEPQLNSHGFGLIA